MSRLGVEHVLGPADAAVTIVEYGDFQCALCKQAAPLLNHLVERFPDSVALVFRHFPMQDIHPHAMSAAEAAECAAAQGRFWPMHRLLFANQSRLSRRHLLGYARKLDLDTARFRSEMDGHIHLGRIQEQIAGGRRHNMRSAPGLYVNGSMIPVSFGMHAVVAAVEGALDSEQQRL